MRIDTAAAAAILVAMLFSSVRGAPPEEEVASLMQAKLGHSRALLGALTREDYPALIDRSLKIAELTQAAAWQVEQSETYRRESAEMERSAYALHAAAKQKNLDSATLAYIGLTMSCIRCHEYLRGADERDKRRPHRNSDGGRQPETSP